MTELIIEVLDKYGIPITILFAIGLFFWKWVIPAIFKQWEFINSERLKRDEEYRKSVDEYRQNTLLELKELKEDARTDKRTMQEAFLQNVLVTTKLQGTLEQINAQLRELTEEVLTLKQDVNNVYQIVGRDRNLIK